MDGRFFSLTLLSNLTAIYPKSPQNLTPQQFSELPKEMPAGMDTNPCLGHDRDILIALANTVLEGKVLARSKLWACSVYVGISLFWFYFTSDAPLPFFAALTAYDERMPPICSFQRSPRCVLRSVFFVFTMG